MNSWMVFQPPSAVPPMPSATSAAIARRLQKSGRPTSGTVTFSLGAVRRGCWPNGPLPKLPPPMYRSTLKRSRMSSSEKRRIWPLGMNLPASQRLTHRNMKARTIPTTKKRICVPMRVQKTLP